MVIKVLNLDKCLKKFGDVSNIDLNPVIKDGTAMVQNRAKQLAPKHTRTLERSIHRRVLTMGKKGWGYGVVFTNLEYAIYKEFGTTRPHFVPFEIDGNPTGLAKWAIDHGIDITGKNGLMISGKPQPFMIPAYNQMRLAITQRMNEYLDQQVKLKSGG